MPGVHRVLASVGEIVVQVEVVAVADPSALLDVFVDG
jgi:hypothetical protein